MKLQQLRYIVEVAKHNLNVSLTAESLYTSQPGISKQIKLLEDELGVQIFARAGKHLTKITPIGADIIRLAQEMLNRAQTIKALSADHSQPNLGKLTIATTYTQARYRLPEVVQHFRYKYAQVTLQLEQGSSQQVINDLITGKADFAIISQQPQVSDDFVILPCYHWNYSVVVPKDHALTKTDKLTLDELAAYPLVSYDYSAEGSDLKTVFITAQHQPNIVFSISDADLIKTYVRLGVGVGIIAKMAFSEEQDSDLAVINAGHLFSYNTTYIVFHRELYIRNYMYDFIRHFSAHLSKELVDKAVACQNNNEILAMFNGIKLPVR